MTLNLTPEQNGVPQYTSIETAMALIGRFCSENLRPKIQEFFNNPPALDWVPPISADEETQKFYQGLQIPLVNDKPSLLLHGLGKSPNPIVDNLFLWPQKHR